MECLFQLDKRDYEYITRTARGSLCRCSLCVYGRKRVEAKGQVPRAVYEADLFQNSLRMLNGRPHKRIIVSNDDLEQVISAILGLRE